MRWLTAEGGSSYARHVRADIEPPLCQECAKTVRNSAIADELAETKDAVELRIPRFGDIEWNALDLLLGFTHQRSAVRYRPRPPMARPRSPLGGDDGRVGQELSGVGALAGLLLLLLLFRAAATEHAESRLARRQLAGVGSIPSAPTISSAIAMCSTKPSDVAMSR
jgi:hypothetical protein